MWHIPSMKLQLRDVTEADLPTLFEFQREPRTAEMAASPVREREAFLNHWRTNILGSAHASAKAIVIDDALVGHICSWDGESGRLVAYLLGEAHWGRGIASAALAEFVAVHERTRPLHAFVVVHNHGSRRVLEKCGFRTVGEPITHEDGLGEQRLELAV